MLLPAFSASSIFQSTFPRGERRCACRFIDFRHLISIHVPTWGTTSAPKVAFSGPPLFQSTFPRGERLSPPRNASSNKSFQSTFPRGERRNTSLQFVVIYRTFQSTFPRGERLIPYFSIGYSISISIHVPTWGTTANFHKYSLLFYAINIIFLLFIIPSLFSLVLFILLF